MAQTFQPTDEPLTEQEKKDMEEILACIRTLRNEGGWGVLSITLKGGDVDEIVTAISKKPKFNHNHN